MKKEQAINKLAHIASVIESLNVDEIDAVEITWLDPCGLVRISPDALRAIVPEPTLVRHTLSAVTLSGTVDGVTIQAHVMKSVPEGV